MTLSIGIPRALYYYRYFPLWDTFFKELGFDVRESEVGRRGLIEKGFKYADDDNCIPIKMAFAHTLGLRDKVDFLFIPRLLSLDSKTCFCPRTAGLPEMLQYSIPGLPPLLDPYIDERYRNTGLFRSLSEMALNLGKSSREIKHAYQKGERAYQLFCKRMAEGERTPELFERVQKKPLTYIKDGFVKKIAIVGHPYCLYDPYFNFDLLRVLEEAHATLYTQEMIPKAEMDSKIREFGKEIYWASGREILGASLYYLDSNDVDGLIYLTCFSCGVDSMIEPLVRHGVKENGRTLYLCLMVDEHTHSGGFLTRVEAFLETVERKKANRRNG